MARPLSNRVHPPALSVSPRTHAAAGRTFGAGLLPAKARNTVRTAYHGKEVLMAARRTGSNRGSIYLGLAGALFATSGALVGGYLVTSGSATPAPAQAAEAP